MINFIINFTLCSGVLLLFYKLFLEKEKMHYFNRFYLIGSIVASILIPNIDIDLEQKPIVNYENGVKQSVSQIIDYKLVASENVNTFQTENSLEINWFYVIYGIVTAFFLARFFVNIFKINQKINRNNKVKYGKIDLVLIVENLVPHSFLNYVFINKLEYEKGEIDESILVHEQTHVEQKHSFDILFIELMKCIFWFNFLLGFYKRAIQLNHEFLADDGVLKSAESVMGYQYLLLQKSTENQGLFPSSNFNFSTTKTRLIMMTKKTSRALKILKQLAIAPIFLITALLFNDCKKTEKESLEKFEFSENGISDVELTDYQKSMEKYISIKGTYENTQINHLPIPKKEEERLLNLFKKMSEKQQDNQDFIFYNAPELEKEYPASNLYETFKDSSQFNILIDKVAVKNVELNNFKNTDFLSFVKYKTRGNYYKNVSNKFYVSFMTEEYFKQKNEKNKKTKLTFWSLNFKKGEKKLVKKYLAKS